MPELASSEREIILYYNLDRPNASKTLGYAKGEGFALRNINILTNKFTGTHLEELASKLKVSIEGLVNKEHSDFNEGLYNSNFSDEDWIKVLQNNPKFLKEPIAIRGHKAIFVKTPSNLSRL
ncbi:hypothetical protein OS188_13285 [Xanthomarina sp. F1114]|uniref:arsenate reductase family protein n=1 Tax=Xanthomarina sp. F1114 TaxID=2996019 RepID=UPI00225E6C1D|nr:hypothetical protein [Xanthomarina sp. F1114]MCX7548925.1 hypothetical protein [Xanthomarina sp. F1114]